MADELDDFFAKKAQKSSNKRKKVNVGEIAERLERNARIQERYDREEEERLQRESQQLPTPPQPPVISPLQIHEESEDSEWLENNPDEDLSSKLEELGIKGMDVSELTEEEEEEVVVEEEVPEPEHAVRTWNFEQDGCRSPKSPDSERAEEIAPQLAKKYVPPSNRYGGRRTAGAKLDLKSEEMFPSIENAEKMEKELTKNEIKKNDNPPSDGWKVQREREADTKSNPNAYRPPYRQSERPTGQSGGFRSAAPAARETTQTAPTPGKYAPPHKRSQGPW